MRIHRIQLIKLSNQEVLDILIIREISPVLRSCQSIALLGINKKISFILKGNLAPESAVLKLSGKDIAGAFRGPVSSFLFKQL